MRTHFLAIFNIYGQQIFDYSVPNLPSFGSQPFAQSQRALGSMLPRSHVVTIWKRGNGKVQNTENTGLGDCRLLSNRKKKLPMVYSLINHAGCWKNTRRICKSRAAIQKTREISIGLPAQ